MGFRVELEPPACGKGMLAPVHAVLLAEHTICLGTSRDQTTRGELLTKGWCWVVLYQTPLSAVSQAACLRQSASFPTRQLSQPTNSSDGGDPSAQAASA